MLEVRQLSKRFGGIQVLDEISLDIAPGEIGAVVGPNGAGKSTLLNIVAGVLAPSAGEVFVGGMDLRGQATRVRRLIGFLPEQCPLYRDLRVEEHLTYRGRLKGLTGKRLRARLRSVIGSCGLEEIRYRLIGRLSLGQRQRVGLADVLLTEPRLMVLDEPFAGLDPEQAERFCDLLATIRAHHSAVLLVTHRLDLIAKICRRCTILSRGRVVGTIDVDDRADNSLVEQVRARLRASDATDDIGGRP